MLDRGPLSDAKVIATLRNFVCVRPLTYENQAESDYLRKIFAPRGFLENTVFTIMDPEAKKYLARPGRGADTLYGDPSDKEFSLPKSLAAVAKPFQSIAPLQAFPSSGNTRYGLNVAACDYRPLALVVGTDEERKTLKSQVAKLAWSEKYWGVFTYAESKPDDLSQISGAPSKSGIYFVQPDEYGVKGTVLGFTDSNEQLETVMREALNKYKPRVVGDHRGHLTNGVKKGIRWKSAIPCEDQQSVQATLRLWGS